MKELLKSVKDTCLDFVLKYNLVISAIISLLLLIFFYKAIEECFCSSKTDILNMIISTSGTIFGFILTFLSIFIVFRTEEKYKKNDKNKNKPLIMLINNSSFNSVYELFIGSSYSLGLLLIISIVYYFTIWFKQDCKLYFYYYYY